MNILYAYKYTTIHIVHDINRSHILTVFDEVKSLDAEDRGQKYDRLEYP